MQSKDVPWYVAEKADYGITGEDLATEYLLGNSDSIKILSRLGFGKGDLVVFCRTVPDKGKVRVATPAFYGNLVSKGYVSDYLRTFGEYEVLEVSGSTEGFVADGTADLGFDFTTYFTKNPDERKATTLETNGLKIIKRIMPTEAVVISKNRQEYTLDSFESSLDYGMDWKKMEGLIPAVVQDADTREVLMLGYVDVEALDKTKELGLATFRSRKRGLWTKGLTSGNTMEIKDILYDCDNDAILYLVRPNGPACHTNERSCFYRQLNQEFKSTPAK